MVSVEGVECGGEVAAWLSKVLGRKCRLVRQSQHHSRRLKRPHPPNKEEAPLLSLANEAQYLVLSQSSVEQLLGEICRNQPEWSVVTVEELALRFRPNFVVGGELEPYAEERWTEVRIGSHMFQVGQSPVSECPSHLAALIAVLCWVLLPGYGQVCEVSGCVCGLGRRWAELRATQNPASSKRKQGKSLPAIIL